MAGSNSHAKYTRRNLQPLCYGQWYTGFAKSNARERNEYPSSYIYTQSFGHGLLRIILPSSAGSLVHQMGAPAQQRYDRACDAIMSPGPKLTPIQPVPPVATAPITTLGQYHLCVTNRLGVTPTLCYSADMTIQGKIQEHLSPLATGRQGKLLT